MPLRQRTTVDDVVHVELYVVPRKYRTAFRKSLREPIGIAQSITRAGAGHGPDFYRVDIERSSRTAPSIGSLLKVRSNEDLWIEIAFYPSWQRRRSILKKIWGNSKFTASVGAIDSLVSRRPRSYGVANALRIL